ncbi:caspase family protein [Iningainema tapete]|uniref:Caspase family protein n=1 Tax=Iningainema tapete BLCC-T55 TaxID=2748662 RepID=A0A8J6XS38_9CYAN|nr:caspase family protein [Iningainema tapete]MBD2777415.1 caspase family protein [Iningainema tapete BLCC-T55]
MKRRNFLQRFGSILTVLGAASSEWLSLGNLYYQALAQPSARKFALLIGINKYQHKDVSWNVSTLGGCITDVELQRELLIHKCGFQSSDILCLTDEQATSDKIETAFVEHLSNVKSGDVVVFHFSGYGSRVKLETQQSEQNALILVNAAVNTQENKLVNYLLEEKLLLMLRSLATDNVIAVLDTSYYYSQNPQPIGLRSRVCQISPSIVAPDIETFHETSLHNACVLTATSEPTQLAMEVQMSGFSAGLFTYALTQHIWEATPATTIKFSISRAASTIQQLGSSKQQPAFLNDKNLQSSTLSEILGANAKSAQGVVTAIEEDGKTVQLWLGGLPPQVLEYYGVNSLFTIINDVETRGGTSVQLRSRNGLTAKALVYNTDSTTLKVGQLITEAVRVLPRNINLTVALDPKLERIERVDATGGFATVARVSLATSGEQPADYVFGKLAQVSTKDSPSTTSTMVSLNRYGLFSLGCELIPNTSGEAGEVVKPAVQRLAPKLHALLAAKLWRLTENEGSSGLSIRGSLENIDILPRMLMQRQTSQLSTESTKKPYSPETEKIPTVSIGSKIQYRVQNMSARPVYLMLLGLNSSRTAIALYPWLKNTEVDNSDAQRMLKDLVIAPGQTLTIPQTTSGFEWVVQGPASISENQLIFSTAPFTQTLLAMIAGKHPRVDGQRILPLLNPIDVAQALLQDLHNASAVTDITATDSYILNVNNWASLSFVYQVV